MSSILIVIPKYEIYINYALNMIIKLPKQERYNIGNSFKNIMYETFENIYYYQYYKLNNYLIAIDAKLNIQRAYIRIMYKQKYIDKKKYEYSISLIDEVGKLIGC